MANRYDAEISLNLRSGNLKAELANLRREAEQLRATQSGLRDAGTSAVAGAESRTGPNSASQARINALRAKEAKYLEQQEHLRQNVQGSTHFTDPYKDSARQANEAGRKAAEVGARAAEEEAKQTRRISNAKKKAADYQDQYTANQKTLAANSVAQVALRREIGTQDEKGRISPGTVDGRIQKLEQLREKALKTAQDQIDRSLALDGGAGRKENIADIGEGKAAQATTNAEIRAAAEKVIAADGVLAKAEADTALSLAQQKAQTDRALAGNDSYTKAVASSTTSLKRQKADLDSQLAGSTAYKKASADAALNARRRFAAETEATNVALSQPAAAPLKNKEARNEIAGQRNSAEANRRYFEQLSRSTGGIQGLATEIGEAKGRTAVFNKEILAASSALQATGVEGKRLAEAEAQLAKTTAQIAANKSQAILSQIKSDESAGVKSSAEIAGEGAAADNAVAQRKRLATNEALLKDTETIKLKAQANVTQERINAALKAEEEAIRGVTQKTVRQGAGQLGGGTFTQNIQQRVSQRQGKELRPATDFSTLGQLTSGALITTGKFAAAGSLFFGITTAIHSSFEEASKLETQFALLENQLQSLGREDDFDTITNGLFSIARNTGIATSALGELALQIRGAFPDKPPEFVNAQVDAAAKIERITGLSTAETTDSLTAISKTFDVNFRQIGDTATGLQQRFGVLSKEIITFSADLAPVAAQAGLSFEKLAGIGAAVQQLSGRSGAGLAEALGRVLSGLQDNAADILSVYQTNDKLLVHQSEVADDLASGNTGDVLERLIKDYDKLTRAQQNLVNSALGGSRQAPVLAALFGGDTIQAELKRINSGGSDVGKLDAQFKKLQGTIGQVFAQIKQVLLQIGVGIAEAGVLDVLKALIGLLSGVLSGFRPIASTVSTVNDALGGLGTKLLAVYAAFRLIKAIGTASLFQGIAAKVGIGAAAAVPVQGYGAPTPPVVAGGGFSAFTTGLLAAGAAAVVAGIALGKLAEEAEKNLKKEVDEATKTSKKDPALALKRANDPGAGLESFNVPLSQSAFDAKQTLGNIPVLGGLFGSGGKTYGQQVQDEYQKQVGAQRIALLKAAKKEDSSLKLSSKELGKVDLSTLDPTNDDSFDLLDDLRDKLLERYGKAYVKALEKKIAGRGKKKKFDTAAALKSGDQQDTETALANKRADYDAGLIDEQGLRSSYATATNALRTLVETGNPNKNQRAEYFKARAESSKFESDLIKSDLDKSRQIRQYTGQETSEANITEAINALRNPKLTDLGTRGDIVGQIFADYQHILQTRIDSVSTAAEKLAIAQAGVSIDPQARVEIARDRIKTILEHSRTASRALNRIAKETGQSVAELQQSVNALALYLGITIAEATSLYLRAQLNLAVQTLAGYQYALSYGVGKVKQAKAAIESQKAKIGALYGSLIDIANDPSLQVNPLEGIPENVTSTADQQAQLATQAAEEAKAAAKEAADAAKAALAARFAYLKALVEGDPVALAQVDLQQAYSEIASAETEADRWNALAHQVSAQHALQDALNAIIDARYEFYGAIVAEDPVAAAKVSLDKAWFDLTKAKGDADKLAAAANLVTAGRAFAKAIFDIGASIRGIAAAMAGFQGDAVKAAELTITDLRNQAYFRLTQGAGAAEINNFKAQIITQQAALRDAQLAEKEGTIDFNLQVQKISTAQAISQYEALLGQADILQLTTAQRRDLILKIQQLKHTLTQDLQFDLPSDLRLPTLYEARRLNQSGGNYQDNRNVNISLTSTDPASTAAAVSQIEDALNAPPVFGGGGRIY